MITRDRVITLLDYDPSTGQFRWKSRCKSEFTREQFWRSFQTRCAGKLVGHGVEAGRYQIICLDKRQYYAHRLAWLIVYGSWPAYVDHVNGDTRDNRIANLREASNAENCRNAGISRRNKSGVLGVHWSVSNNGWVAQIRVNNRPMHLGTFKTIEEASAARAKADAIFGFHPNHGARLAPSAITSMTPEDAA